MALFDLKGRVAIVTGGNGGIGLGMARGLARAGAAVVVVGRNEKKNKEAVKELEALGQPVSSQVVDVAKETACRKMAEDAAKRHGRIDILINNAGTNIRKQPQEYTGEEWRFLIDTNLSSAFYCSQSVYETMKGGGGGKIINIGSMMSIFGASFTAPYAATKGGMVQMTRAFACAWAKDNIQVNAVLPGWIDTDLTRQGRAQIPGLHERVLARTPAGRWGTPDDHAGIAVFLGGPASDFVTGTAIPVDGGFAIAM
jgi:2-deoxy-D-gluconate 3-dehydrogenase